MKKEPEVIHREFFCELANGWYLLASNPITWTGENLSALFVEKDITDTKEVESLEQIAYLDLPTGAYNRRYAVGMLNDLFKQKAPVAICFIDLDNLKNINDTYGHAAGDEYILTVYKAIYQSVRKDDFVCRIGGDEFLAILVGASDTAATRVSEKVNSILQRINKEKALVYDYSISTGIVISDYELYDSVDKLIEAADTLMYENKKNKKATRQ